MPFPIVEVNGVRMRVTTLLLSLCMCAVVFRTVSLLGRRFCKFLLVRWNVVRVGMREETSCESGDIMLCCVTLMMSLGAKLWPRNGIASLLADDGEI